MVLYREHTPGAQLIGLVVALFAWSGIFAVILYPPLDAFFISFFFWLPGWFFFAEDFSRYSSEALLLTWVPGLVLNAFAGPVTEELYFRGYLLAPHLALRSVLFSLYHFFTPWQNVGRIFGLLPMVYAVWWKREIRIGIAVHVLGNLFSRLSLLPVLFG